MNNNHYLSSFFLNATFAICLASSICFCKKTKENFEYASYLTSRVAFKKAPIYGSVSPYATAGSVSENEDSLSTAAFNIDQISIKHEYFQSIEYDKKHEEYLNILGQRINLDSLINTNEANRSSSGPYFLLFNQTGYIKSGENSSIIVLSATYRDNVSNVEDCYWFIFRITEGKLINAQCFIDGSKFDINCFGYYAGEKNICYLHWANAKNMINLYIDDGISFNKKDNMFIYVEPTAEELSHSENGRFLLPFSKIVAEKTRWEN